MRITDGTAESGSVNDFTIPPIVTSTFNPMETYVEKDFTILVDDVIEDIEKFTITLASPGGGGGEIKEPSTATVYITDATSKYTVILVSLWSKLGRFLSITNVISVSKLTVTSSLRRS